MKPHEDHRGKSPSRLRVRIVTVSSSRFKALKAGKKLQDGAGNAAEAETKKFGNVVSERSLISDSRTMIVREVKRFLSSEDDLLVLSGGTGVSTKDVTIESVGPFIEKELPGFGEVFRRLSYDEVGAAAMLTRATAGVARGKLIVCLPGSPGAVRTALRATMGEFPHAVFVARS